jgi:hypothetical protein
MTESALNNALKHFEAAEANLVKAEKVLTEIYAAIPTGIAFVGNDPVYEENCRCFEDLLSALPKINEWKPDIILLSLDEIAQNRLDANEVGEIECLVSVEQDLGEPARLLRKYRHIFNKTRKALVRESINEAIDKIDACLTNFHQLLDKVQNQSELAYISVFEEVKENVALIDTLLGSSVTRPNRWDDLNEHLAFGMIEALQNIVIHDWPPIKNTLRNSLYGEKEPIPIGIEDLGDLVRGNPKGPVAIKLKWDKLSGEDFERLIFNLISTEKGYENPEWLMKTNAPDKGRDLSVYRIFIDPLGGTIRQRVIIQCKHWLSKSVSPAEIGTLKEQMKLWESPRIDVHVIATSGRFTSDAVDLVERHNQSDCAMRIEMWPESHLERLLATRPSFIAEFGLR